MRSSIKKLLKSTPALVGPADRLYQGAVANYWRAKGRAPVLVYQMGKVGSRTICDSLKSAQIDRPIYHLHFLTDERIEEMEGTKNNRIIWTVKSLRKQIDAGLTGKKWKVITLVREPVGRNLSMFFYNLHYRFDDFANRYESGDITPSDLSEMFFNDYEHQHRLPLTWFDDELKKIFGVDVFASAFPKESGYQVIEAKECDVLVIKLEELREIAGAAFSEFLGLESFNIVNTNVSSEKDYNLAYRHFIDHLDVPAAYLDRMYNSDFARHFYTDEEIARYREKWSRQPGTA